MRNPIEPRCPGQRGVTYVEMLLTVTITGLIMAALMGVVDSAMTTGADVRGRNELAREARFALQRMVSMAKGTRRLLLPLADNPATNWPEHIREQTIPASPPIGDSSFASAVLAVTLPEFVDLDRDGFADADDDRDGRIDEDLPNDAQHDFSPGIVGIDDDGDGTIDDGTGWAEDDEDGVENEDPLDGIDNDGDGSIDEDPPSDNDGNACAGICSVDDDGDGNVDEGAVDDDDEDGGAFDDPYDPVVFYLVGNRLIERMPVPWNEDGNSLPDGPVDGRDFVESTLADNVTRFRVERIAGAGGALLVDLVLELTDPAGGDSVALETRVRVGSAP